MRKIILLFVFAVLGTVLYAQDKIHTVNGDTFETKVLSIDKQMVSLSPFESGGTTISKLPRNYIKSIVFADGLELPFNSDGTYLSDGLVSTSNIKVKGGNIYAEGLIKLTQEQMCSRLGEERYYLHYKPARAKQTVGLAQLFSGIAIFGTCAIFDAPNQPKAFYKDVWYRNTDFSIVFHGIWFQKVTPLAEEGREIFSGRLNPYLVSAEFLGVTTLVGGLTNLISSSSLIKSAIDDSPKATPTLSGTKAKYWTGLALSVAGAGALVAGTLDLNAHKQWYIEHNPDPRYEKHEGDAPIAGPILALAGSVLLNVGITQFAVANTRLKGFSQLSNPIALNVGITPHGYGMTVSF